MAPFCYITFIFNNHCGNIQRQILKTQLSGIIFGDHVSRLQERKSFLVNTPEWNLNREWQHQPVDSVPSQGRLGRIWIQITSGISD